MSYARFVLFEIIAALLWNTIYSLIGYFIAVEIDLLHLFFQRAGLLIAGILVVLFAAWQFWKRRNGHARRSSQRAQQQHARQGAMRKRTG